MLNADLAVRVFATDAVITSDRAGQVIELNPAAERLLGWTRATALGRTARRRDRRRGAAGARAQRRADPRRAPRGRAPAADQRAAAARCRRRDRRSRRRSSATSAPRTSSPRRASGRSMTPTCSSAPRKSLAESLDVEATVARAVAAFVPELADVCIISSLEPGGHLRIRAAAGGDAELQRTRRAPRGTDRRGERDLHIPAGRPHALAPARQRAGRRAAAANALEAELAAHLGAHWQTVLPLRSRGDVWGIVFLLSRDTAPNRTAPTLRLMQQLAERAGQALVNARLTRPRPTRARASPPPSTTRRSGWRSSTASGIITEANPALCGDHRPRAAARRQPARALPPGRARPRRAPVPARRRTFGLGPDARGAARRSAPTVVCRSRTSPTASATRASCSTWPTTTR